MRASWAFLFGWRGYNPGMNLDVTLAQLADDPFAAVDLAAVALHLAAEEYPNLDVPTYLTMLDEYAEELMPRMRGTLEQRVAELTHFLFEDEGFTGNATNYYEAENSYFNDVLDRKLGIPLTLSVLAMSVGQRCGLTIVGVGLPGHFVAKAIDGDNELLFDPYHGGQFLNADGCSSLVEAVTGQPFVVTEETVAASPPGFIVLRMLNNLKGIYLRTPDFNRAARVTHRIVQLTPTDPLQRRDLGVTLVHAGKPGKAIDHLQTYLTMAPDAEDATVVQDFLKEARREVARWN